MIIKEPATFEAALDTVFEGMKAIMVDRHRKYGPGNITATGVMGLYVRCQDKIARIGQALRSKTMEQVDHMGTSADYADESFDDAWLDLANYSGLIYFMLKKDWWNLPMEEQKIRVLPSTARTASAEDRQRFDVLSRDG